VHVRGGRVLMVVTTNDEGGRGLGGGGEDGACPSPLGLSGTTTAICKHLRCVYIPQYFQ
jgi:hypothetical protein